MQLQRPVKGQEKTDWRLTQKFGERPEVYKPMGYKGHMGLDYAGPKPGDKIDVYSAVDGHCTQGNDPKGYGLYLKQVFEYEGVKYEIIYGHLAKITKIGPVKKGDKIGVMGTTGFSTGIHLHFEIKDPREEKNGYKGRIDPLPFIVDWNTEIVEEEMPIAELQAIWKRNVKPEKRKFKDYTLDGRIKYLIDLGK